MSGLQRGLLITAGALVALTLAFSAGRFSKPAEIQTVEVVKTEVVERVVEKRVEVKAKARVITVDRVIEKEGRVVERVVVREVEKHTTDTHAAVDRNVKADVETKTVTKNEAPRLTVSVLAGADLTPAWQPIPSGGPLTLGVSVHYRIAGPLVVGAWGLHTGAFGVSVGAQF